MIKRTLCLMICAVIAFTALAFPAFADSSEPALRRPISPEQPMWIVHIDTWNTADPDKIIDLIPEDILPYVVFNISLSVNWDSEQKRFMIVEYGYETAKSWLRTCAERGVWAMIQPASGGQCHLPDYDPAEVDYEETVFGEFFRDYPNFLGFNYCEQFWGFEQEDFPITPIERYIHFAGLLELCHKYGGYLVDSWCGNQWGQWLNPLAMLKQVPEFEEAARKYPENFILLEKYTQTGYLDDVESLVLGTFLSGYCDNFGIRYDETGWTDESGEGTSGYLLSTGLSVQFERMILNGMTVIDGPELVPEDDFYEADDEIDKNGYAVRKWAYYDQFYNVMIDMFRKTLDGTFRIPTRDEVIERTKIILVNDIDSGSDDKKYCTPETLFEGLYKIEGDGNLRDNHSFYKSTGRFPTIPTTAGFADESLRDKFELVVNHSEYDEIWPTLNDKVFDLEDIFPELYTGDMYCAQRENVWITYNPYKANRKVTAEIPLRYNTCEKLSLEYPRYSVGVIKETADGLSVYLNNFDDVNLLTTRRDVIKISGATSEPTYTVEDRAINSMKPTVTAAQSGSEWVLTVEHNGPVQIEIKCSGSAAGRLTDYSEATYTEPERPPVYEGSRQYEGEFFDVKDVDRIIRNGASENIRNYTGQGYLSFGDLKGASARDTVRAFTSGTYTLELKYSCLSDISGAAVYVNGSKKNLELEKCASLSDWGVATLPIKLKKGDNKVEIRASGELADSLYIDNFTVTLVKSGVYIPTAAIIAAICLVVSAVVVVIILTAKKKSKRKKA